MSLYLYKVSIESDLSAVANIIIFRSNAVNLYCAEHSYCREALVDDCISSYFYIGSLLDPFYKDFAGYERILRHGSHSFPFTAEILGQALNYCRPVITEDNKIDIILLCELCLNSQVGFNFLPAFIFCCAIRPIPAYKVLAFQNRVCRQGKSISVIVGIRLVCFAINRIGDSEDILRILQPDIRIFMNRNRVCESLLFFASLINPSADIALFSGNLRNVVEAVRGRSVNCFCSKGFCFVFIIESYCVYNRIIIRNNDNISGWYIGSFNDGARIVNADCWTLCRLNNCP